MKKIVIAIIASILALSLFIIISSSQNKPIPTNFNQPARNASHSDSGGSQPVSTNSALLTYSDPSGFSFKYPKSLSFSPITPLANSYYSHLEATTSGKPDKVTIIIESTIVKSIADFKKTNTQIPKNVISTKLADLDALEYNDTKSHITQAIDQGVLITLTTPLTDKTFWEPIHRTLVSTFKFVTPSQETTSSSSSSGSGEEDVVFEGEETIE